MTDKLVERLRELVWRLIENDPAEPVADNGCTVFDLWRPDAVKTLAALESLTPRPAQDDRWLHCFACGAAQKGSTDCNCQQFTVSREELLGFVAALESLTPRPAQTSDLEQRAEKLWQKNRVLDVIYGHEASYLSGRCTKAQFADNVLEALASSEAPQDGASQEDGRS